MARFTTARHQSGDFHLNVLAKREIESQQFHTIVQDCYQRSVTVPP